MTQPAIRPSVTALFDQITTARVRTLLVLESAQANQLNAVRISISATSIFDPITSARVHAHADAQSNQILRAL